MGKLNGVLGGLMADVDAIVSKAKIDPEDVCTPPVKKQIRNLQQLLAKLMQILPVLQQIVQVVKIIRKVIKIVKKILEY